jgi:anti-sigma factor RsiW
MASVVVRGTLTPGRVTPPPGARPMLATESPAPCDFVASGVSPVLIGALAAACESVGVRTRTPQVTDGVTGEQLAALADGTLSGADRAAVEARVAASPEASEMLRAQRRALAALRSFDPPLPPGLEERVRVAPVRRTPFLRTPVGFATAGAMAVLVLAIAIAIAPGSRDGTVAELAALSARPSLELPAPASDGRGALDRSFAGVTFPDWDRAHQWRAVGARRDTVDGRATDTVYYQHTHHRIGYTVLAGEPVAPPGRGRSVERGGVRVQLYRDGPRTVAVFERGGRTCVLAGVVHFEETLIKLATWRGEDDTLTF